MSTFTWASHAPLFDRLCAPVLAATPLGSPPQGDNLKASIARDLERLLNTRNGLTLEEAFGSGSSVMSYGIPDILGLGSQPDACQAVADLVQRAITSFEPRLREVTVRAQPDEGNPDRVRLTITAAVAIGRQMRRVNFDVAVGEAVMVQAPRE